MISKLTIGGVNAAANGFRQTEYCVNIIIYIYILTYANASIRAIFKQKNATTAPR
jgi:hypothetical protein